MFCFASCSINKNELEIEEKINQISQSQGSEQIMRAKIEQWIQQITLNFKQKVIFPSENQVIFSYYQKKKINK